MTAYVSAELLIRINQENCGAGAGVRDRSGIEGVAGRPSSTFSGEDLYATIWLKAAVMLHGLSSTQYFHDGNKRTAWLAASLFLRSNGHPLRDTPTIAREAFVLVSSVNLFSVEQIAEWLEEHRLRASDRKLMALVAGSFRVHEDGTFDAENALMAGLVSNGFPYFREIGVAAHILWRKSDAYRAQTVRIYIEGDDPPIQIMMPSGIDEFSIRHDWSEAFTPLPAATDRYGTGMVPHIITQYLHIMVRGEGLAWLRVDLDDDLFARIAIESHYVSDF